MREFLIVLFAVSGQLSVIFDIKAFDLTALIGFLFGMEVLATLVFSKIQIGQGGSRIVVALGALVIWIFIASLAGKSSVYVWTKWMSLAAVLVGFIYVLTKGSRISFLRIVYWHCLYCLVLAILYYQELISAGNLQSILWNSDSLGLSDYLTSSDYFYLCFLMLYSEKRWKLLLLAFVLFSPVLVFLGARGAALFFALVLFAALFKDRIKGRYLVVGLSFVLIGGASLSDTMMKYRFESAISGDDESLNQRQIYFVDAGNAILKQPLFGVGFGSFGASIYGEDRRLYPHNLFLEVLVELGVVGLGLLVYFLAGAWRIFSLSHYKWLLLFLFLDLMKSYTYVDLKYLWILVGLAIANGSNILGDLRNHEVKDSMAVG